MFHPVGEKGTVLFMIRLPATMAWIKQRTAEFRISNDEGWNRFAKSFLKQTEYIYSTFDVGRWMFNVHQFLFRCDRPLFWPAAGLNPEPGTISLGETNEPS